MKSGLASRDTWVNGPLLKCWAVSVSQTRAPWRLAVVHRPITEPRSFTLPCLLPDSSCEMGTWIVIE